MYLIHHAKDVGKVEALRKDLEKFRIDFRPVELRGNLLEGMFRAFGQILQEAGEDRLLVNISPGDKMSTCAALAASFVNGLKAFHVEGDRVEMFPIMKFSYYRLLPERKLGIINFLRGQPDCCSSLEELSGRLDMSLPLISYHINGNSKAEGLISQGLVEVHIGPRGKTQVMLSELGRLIADGYASPSDKTKSQ